MIINCRVGAFFEFACVAPQDHKATITIPHGTSSSRSGSGSGSGRSRRRRRRTRRARSWSANSSNSQQSAGHILCLITKLQLRNADRLQVHPPSEQFRSSSAHLEHRPAIGSQNVCANSGFIQFAPPPQKKKTHTHTHKKQSSKSLQTVSKQASLL